MMEYLYDLIVRKGFKFLFKRLETADYRKVRNAKMVRAFLQKESLEDKITLLLKLGAGCAVVFWDNDREVKTLRDLLIGMENPSEDLSRRMIEERVFCTSDVDIIRLLQTMSKVCNSTTYAVNRKYYEIKNKSHNTSLSKKLQAEKNLEWYSKTIQFSLGIAGVLEPFDISPVHFRILVYLHTLPNGATVAAIARNVDRLKISTYLKQLDEMNMIRWQGEVISIDVYGIMILEQIFAKFP